VFSETQLDHGFLPKDVELHCPPLKGITDPCFEDIPLKPKDLSLEDVKPA
jgi:hypothetical protein